MKILKFGILLLFSFNFSICYSQQFIDSLFLKEILKSHKDSIAMVFLDPVHIWGDYSEKYKKKYQRKYRKAQKKYQRTVKNVKKVYPYAKLASKTILKINNELPKLKSIKERKKFLKKEYKTLMRAYKKPIMSLKISQGKILLLLIYRETGNSTFKHIKEFRGTTPAIFWQTISRLFGHNLKSKYDPNGKHKYIENIVEKIENGEI